MDVILVAVCFHGSKVYRFHGRDGLSMEVYYFHSSVKIDFHEVNPPTTVMEVPIVSEIGLDSKLIASQSTHGRHSRIDTLGCLFFVAFYFPIG